ncbi:MAG: hypothetical protein PF795_08625 [Kiritimatiellae bacterium]|nr:hypothetical protein [Kiritimatiellia bacterium]
MILFVWLLFESKLAVYFMERDGHSTQKFIQQLEGRVIGAAEVV